MGSSWGRDRVVMRSIWQGLSGRRCRTLRCRQNFFASPGVSVTTAMCTPIVAVRTPTQYWVHVRGSPWWPAKIVDPESLPESVRTARPKGDDFACLKFYGENAYSWARLTDQQRVLPLEYDSPNAKKNSKMLQEALVMAQRDGGVVPSCCTCVQHRGLISVCMWNT